MLQKRTNILFDLDTWKRLSDLAREQHTSVGELTRKAVKKMYLEEDIYERRRRAIEETKRLRKQIKRTFTATDIKEMINYGRKY